MEKVRVIFLSFFHKKNAGYRSIIWFVVLSFFLCTTTGYAAYFKGGSGSGYSYFLGDGDLIPAALVFTTNMPSKVMAEQQFYPQPAVRVTNANGDFLTPDNCMITLDINNDPSMGAGALSGTVNWMSVAGLAQFENLSINKVGEMYSLRARTNSGDCSGMSSYSLTSSAFDVTAPMYTINSELLYNAAISPYYFIQSWLEKGGVIISDNRWDSSDITVVVSNANGGEIDTGSQPVYAAAVPLGAPNVFRFNWSGLASLGVEATYMGEVNIKYPHGGPWYKTKVVYNPNKPNAAGGGGGLTEAQLGKITSINWEDVTKIRDTATAIKASTDTINWTDIKGIKETIGVGQTSVSLATMLTKANWDNLGEMGARGGINWEDLRTLAKAGIKWQEIGVAGINWAVIKKITSTDINWMDIGRVSNAGINWLDVGMMAAQGVNWQDLKKMTYQGVNWSDIESLADAGTNWTGISALSKAGINWTGIDALSKSGVNWSGIDSLSRGGVNWTGIEA